MVKIIFFSNYILSSGNIKRVPIKNFENQFTQIARQQATLILSGVDHGGN
jgi:hypothetical protein